MASKINTSLQTSRNVSKNASIPSSPNQDIDVQLKSVLNLPEYSDDELELSGVGVRGRPTRRSSMINDDDINEYSSRIGDYIAARLRQDSGSNPDDIEGNTERGSNSGGSNDGVDEERQLETNKPPTAAFSHRGSDASSKPLESSRNYDSLTPRGPPTRRMSQPFLPPMQHQPSTQRTRRVSQPSSPFCNGGTSPALVPPHSSNQPAPRMSRRKSITVCEYLEKCIDGADREFLTTSRRPRGSDLFEEVLNELHSTDDDSRKAANTGSQPAQMRHPVCNARTRRNGLTVHFATTHVVADN